MRASKALFFFLMVGFCMISLNVNTANASDQICFNLSLDPPYPVGSNTFILKLGIMDYGNYHFAVSGTDSRYVMPTIPVDIGLVHGNAELVNGKVEVSLSGTGMGSDNKTVSAYFYHLRLDPTTLSGAYTFGAESITFQKGPVSVVSCSDW